MTTAHIREAQQLGADALVELFTLDTSMLTNIYGQPGTGAVYTWCPGTIGGAPVKFGGVTYLPMPIEGSGWEWNGQGKLPRPKLKVSNISGLASGLVIQFGDLLGAYVTRQRTFAKFLDGQPSADPSAAFEPDRFRIDRKSAATKQYVEWELAADFDQANVMLPRRQTLRDACTETYRVWTGSTFQQGTCPYAGGTWFDASNTQVFDPSKDSCSHRLSGCMARYPGRSNPLPFSGWPGVAQTAF